MSRYILKRLELRQIAETLAARNVDVVIHYNSDRYVKTFWWRLTGSSKQEAEATLGRLRAAGVKAAAIQADLRHTGAIAK